MKELDACVERLDALKASMVEFHASLAEGKDASTVEPWIGSVEQVRDALAVIGDRIREEMLLARQDAVTGLANRRAFDAMLDRCCRDGRLGATDGTWTLALIDIDHFKWVNDRWGHAVGDEVLRKVAQTLLQHCDDACVVARFGGEEFAVLFECPLEKAVERLERFRADVAHAPESEGRGHITCSGGAAERETHESIGGWMRRVDAALYCAKQHGRDRIVWRTGTLFWCSGEPVAFLQRLADSDVPSAPESLDLRLLQRLEEVPGRYAPDGSEKEEDIAS
jgi:diguanylate cyclase (GGDEF)-like protein